MAKEKDKTNWDWIKDIVLRILKVERTSAGRVNVLGVFFIGLTGVLYGGLISVNGVILFIVLLISATISDLVPRYKAKPRIKKTGEKKKEKGRFGALILSTVHVDVPSSD